MPQSAPRVNLTEAETQARQLELNEQRKLTNWTGPLNTLNNQLRDANLTIAQAKCQQQAELESQWVRAPIAGVVSDIRVTAVNTKGINLEVMIVEMQQSTASTAHPTSKTSLNVY